MRRMALSALIATVLLWAGGRGLAPEKLAAQEPPAKKTELPKLSGGGILDQLGGQGLPAGEQLTLTGEYTIYRGTRQGRLSVRAEIIPNWHVYSTTQRAGGPMASQFLVESSPDFRLTRPFASDRAPHIKQEEFFPVPSEEFEHEVTWSAPFQLADGVDPAKLNLVVKFTGQVCEDGGSCMPINKQPVAVKFAGEVEPPAIGEFQPKRTHALIRGQITPRTVKPGETVKVALTAEPTSGFHIYAQAPRGRSEGSQPTLIAWKNNQGWETGEPVASEKPIEHPTSLADEPVQYYHEKPVTWTVDVRVPADAAPGGYELRGLIGFQTCTNSGCDLPSGAEFAAVVEVAVEKTDPKAELLAFAPATYSAAAKLAGTGEPTPPPTAVGESPPPVTGAPPATGSAAPSTGSAAAAPAGEAGVLSLDRLKPVGGISKQQSMWVVLPMAFLAGFILNFMPCVLPVIGLKLVSFVHQAGAHRSRIFMLNLWYSLGLMAVFLVLASLAVFAGFGWGDQFRSATFNIVLACVVFAFALSFLGVWEIPLPGFVGSGGVNKAAEHEGYVGAFFKGVLTTVLATPCGGPMLVPALTWAVAQPPAVTYVGFACVGLGMAFPYLVVGAFPRTIAFLPKPGDWMETFKHVMGFILMGTVVFILTFIRISLVIPTVAMMMGLWASLWWIGRVPVWDELNRRIRAWAWGSAFATVIGLFSFMWLDKVMESRFEREIDSQVAKRLSQRPDTAVDLAVDRGGTELPWQPYSFELLSRLVSNKRTVFIDFTADW